MKLAQFNVRVEPDVPDRVRLAAQRAGVSLADWVRPVLAAALEASEAAAEDQRTAPARAVAQSDGQIPVDLVAWLALRTSRPKAVLRAAIQGGRVKVGDSFWTMDTVLPHQLERGVSLDGRRV